MQRLDLSYNSLSGRVPENLLVKKTNVALSLGDVDIFRQWGAHLCAHLTSDQLLRKRHWVSSLLDDVRVFSADQQSGLSMNSESHRDCSALWLNVTASAIDYVVPDSFPREPPTFSWPSEVHRNEVFMGLCDLPEMLGLMCEPFHASRSVQPYKSQPVTCKQSSEFV